MTVDLPCSHKKNILCLAILQVSHFQPMDANGIFNYFYFIALTATFSKGQMCISFVFCSQHRSKLLEILLFCSCQTGVSVQWFENVKPKQSQNIWPVRVQYLFCTRCDWIQNIASINTPLIHSFTLVLSSKCSEAHGNCS